MAATRTTEAAIKRALTAWKAATESDPASVEIAPDGTIRITAAVDRPAADAQPAQPKRWQAG